MLITYLDALFSDLELLSNMESLKKEEWDKDSLTKKGNFILEEI